MDRFQALTELILEGDLVRLRQGLPKLFEAIPELIPMDGFDQRSPHHAYDVLTHTLLVTAALPPDPALRWAGLLHDVGKVGCFTLDETGRGHFKGHAPAGAELADRILIRLGAPKELNARVTTLIGLHMYKPVADREALGQAADRLGRATMEQLLTLQEADMCSKGRGDPREREIFAQVKQLLAEL